MGVGSVFDLRFGDGEEKSDLATHSGIPLGIAGDTAPNVLWRIQHGELPELRDVKVIWLVLGTNDVAIKQCSEEVVLLGILRVIEELQVLKPNAKIVINSILPMTDDEKGRVPNLMHASHAAAAGKDSDGGARDLVEEHVLHDYESFDRELK